MSKLLEGKTALILGLANKWSIAYAIGQAMSREGAKLILTYQNERQQKTVQDLGGELGAAKILACDVTSDAEIASLITTLKAADVTLDAVVHSIAFANKEDLSRPFVETSRAGYLLAQDVSAYSFVAVCNAVVPLMPNGGSIMTLTYLGSTRVCPNYNVMGIAKAALEASMKYLAYDLGPQNIRVNAISAGPIKTASARGIKDFTAMHETVAAHSPMKRVTDPAEVGDSAVFLASHLGRGVTGNVLYVDAGFQIMAM